MSPLFSRRDVLKTLLVGSATSLLGAKVWSAQTVIDLQPTNDAYGIARIRLQDFPALGVNSGSVRLGSSALKPGDAGPEGLYFPILINRLSATEYLAFKAECVHAGCVVGKFNGDEFVPNAMFCPCHGTQYDIRGRVIVPPKDSPGLLGTRLIEYPATLANGILTLRMLDFGFDLTQTALVSGGRLQLSWLSFRGTEYEVRYRRLISDLPEVVPFARTANGVIGETFLTSPGGIGTVYVEAREGIYQIAIHLAEV